MTNVNQIAPQIYIEEERNRIDDELCKAIDGELDMYYNCCSYKVDYPVLNKTDKNKVCMLCFKESNLKELVEKTASKIKEGNIDEIPFSRLHNGVEYVSLRFLKELLLKLNLETK